MNRLLIILLIFISFHCYAIPEIYYLKSGDTIFGELISETKNDITIKTDFGELTINKKDLQQDEIELLLKSGDRLQGLLIKQTSELIIIQTSFSTLTINKTKIKEIIFKDKIGLDDKTSDDYRWYFSDDQLLDIWFDPTGMTLNRSEIYISGLSWAVGVNDKLQLSSRWVNYFIGDLNIRPKYKIFESSDINSIKSFSIGAHLHTAGLPLKYELKDVTVIEEEYNEFTGEIINTESYIEEQWIRVGSTFEKDDWDEEQWNDNPGESREVWGEFFAAYSQSNLRSTGQGRTNYTFGTSVTYFPDYELMPRVYAALDFDILKNVKLMSEVFYDPYYVPLYWGWGESETDRIPVFFDIGFITNMITKNKNLWLGIHFQQPFFVLYYKF
ncbi:MAG: hypothetical protein HRU38_13585 [Saccharospirillaceae bacterium]|nr:hypothetical protein [Pseudomonadales bacterium]NRB79676.1 hypothetical protein [Saccharospirillaceae bacterium]